MKKDTSQKEEDVQIYRGSKITQTLRFFEGEEG
jgi:hypothetical protein